MARNSIILNGKSSDTITGLLIQELPPISKPLMRSQVEEIDGRDGDIITKLGFSAYDKEISVGLYGNFDINEIIAYFNSEGTVTFSNEPDKFYYYQILEQIDFERLVRFRTATINFHVQPFKYSTTEEAETIEAGTVSGEGNNLVLENTSDAPFSKLTPKGDAYQQTYSGKNLLDYSTMVAGYVTASGGFSTSQTQGEMRSQFIKVQPNTTYYFSIIETSSSYPAWARIGQYSSDNTSSFIQANSYWSFTTTATTEYVVVSARNLADATKVQLELGSTATDYEQYVGGIPAPNPDYPQDIQVVTGEQTVKVTGKNLFDKDNMDELVGYYIDGSGAIVAGSGNYLTWLELKPNTTYTISQSVRTAQTVRIGLFPSAITTSSTGTVAGTFLSGADIEQTFTTTSTNYWLAWVYWNSSQSDSGTYTRDMCKNSVQVELGSTATTYEPYQSQSYPISLGSTELAKIGTYQDYIWKDSGTWKVHKETQKKVLNGSESWSLFSTAASELRYSFSTSLSGKKFSSNVTNVACDTFTVLNSSGSSAGDAEKYTCRGTTYNTVFYLMTPRATISGETSEEIVANFKVWLASHVTTVYYQLATATDTTITDETLIGQLEALNAAHAYKGRTHIISTAGSDANLPHIIEAKVLGSSDTTITNAGNFISKPKFTIYGSGNIGLYINGIQILQIALGDEQYITIDAAQMEAYKDTLDNLKNRLVTGDYTNLALNPGENQISFSGSVEKYIVENYSRWL